MPSILTLLTDFGHHDWYVAAVKGVVLGGAPHTTIVDPAKSRGIERGDRIAIELELK